jgi:hypothetical protein
MEELLKQLRQQLKDVDVEKMLKDVDLRKFDAEQLRHIDFSKGRKKVRKQLEQIDNRKREEEAAGEGFLGGVLLGVVVGAILALIFAPRSGSETRDIVAGTATDLKHKAEGLVSQKEDVFEEAEASTLPDEPAIERDFGSSPSSSL